mmetsp:Transcript_36161/g.73586  ORF Transcript_36161/g.73586 Transcript_36161/m.73586 type:complete len:234 (+) Transcript_36161:2604-3305(+)
MVLRVTIHPTKPLKLRCKRTVELTPLFVFLSGLLPVLCKLRLLLLFCALRYRGIAHFSYRETVVVAVSLHLHRKPLGVDNEMNKLTDLDHVRSWGTTCDTLDVCGDSLNAMHEIVLMRKHALDDSRNRKVLRVVVTRFKPTRQGCCRYREISRLMRNSLALLMEDWEIGGDTVVWKLRHGCLVDTLLAIKFLENFVVFQQEFQSSPDESCADAISPHHTRVFECLLSSTWINN